MKKYINAFVFIAVLITMVLSGCYKLDRIPQDKLSPSLFWKTPEQAKQAVVSCYAALKQTEVYNQFFAMDCLSDIGMGYDAPGYWDISRSLWTSRTSYVINRWSQSYEGIRRANEVIKNITSSELEEPIKIQINSEAKFLRAVFYNFLLIHYGGVPIYDETTDYNKDYMAFKKVRATADDVREFVIGDLNDAIENLPVRWDGPDYGRATKGAAYALRGKVYLYNEQYDLATKDFEEIILDPSGRGYGYELYPDYAELFTPDGDESNEMIFAIQNYASQTNSLGMPYAHFMGSNATLGTSWNNVMPSVDLVNSYETKDGRPFDWDDFIPGYNENMTIREEALKATLTDDNTEVKEYPRFHDELLDMYDHRDPRMKQTIILPYTNYLGWIGNENKITEFVYNPNVTTTNGFVVINRYKSNFLYLFRKFVPEGNMGGLITASQRAHIPINFPIIRYADVLLMLAECYNEQGNIDEAVKYINMVRARPSTAMPGINSGPVWLEAGTKEEVFKRIVHERAVEFAAEGLRYYDLRRWGMMEDLMNKDVVDALDTKIYTTKFNNKDYLWPIPGTEIDKNPDLEQNPGW